MWSCCCAGGIEIGQVGFMANGVAADVVVGMFT